MLSPVLSPVAASLAAGPLAALSDHRLPAARALHLPATQRILAEILVNRPGAAEFFGTVRGLLERRGYALASMPGLAALPVQQRDTVAVAASAVLGAPSPVGGTSHLLVWDVRPRPAPPAGRGGGHPFPDGDAGLHTDSAVVPRPERWFGLWCLRPAGDGGACVLADGERVWEALGGQGATVGARETLMMRDAPMWNGQRLIGIRVLSRAADGRLVVRYRADLLERGIRLAAVAADDPLLRALDRLREVLAGPALRETVRLETDQVLFVDNHRVLHGRERFADPGRHLLRIRMGHGPLVASGALTSVVTCQ